MFGLINEISLIIEIDGPGCGDESTLGYVGLIIWMPLAFYLMAGQFVICEEYFVPILAQLGDRLQMAEDVQGATLLAVGSSSPELFTAMLGVIFYPDDNPGPGTNVGSAVFNLCIIIGLSAIFAPRAVKLQMIPFLRDSICYLIGLVELYVFYTVISPGEMSIIESILLVAWWALYCFMVYRTDLLKVRCCCCIPEEDKATGVEHELEQVGDEEANAMSDVRPGMSVISRGKNNQRLGVSFSQSGAPQLDMDYCPNNIRMSRAIPENTTTDDDIQQLVDDLNRRQRINVNKGWMVVVMPVNSKELKKARGHISSGPVSDQDQGRAGSSQFASNNTVFVRRRTLLETILHEKELAAHQSEEDHGPDGEHGHGGLLHKILKPWTLLFSCTLPSPEGSFVTRHIYLAIIAIVAWLGILTFFVVDCSEKIGECFGIPGNLLGITLLAIGSSLPDCISSVIVARQMKIDMAVANAFGSNIFDVNLCVGFSFVLGSIAKIIQGEPTNIDLGEGDALKAFNYLIMAAAAYLVILWGMMWCTIFKLEKWIGYVLLTIYVAFICVFTALFLSLDSGEEGAE